MPPFAMRTHVCTVCTLAVQKYCTVSNRDMVFNDLKKLRARYTKIGDLFFKKISLFSQKKLKTEWAVMETK